MRCTGWISKASKFSFPRCSTRHCCTENSEGKFTTVHNLSTLTSRNLAKLGRVPLASFMASLAVFQLLMNAVYVAIRASWANWTTNVIKCSVPASGNRSKCVCERHCREIRCKTHRVHNDVANLLLAVPSFHPFLQRAEQFFMVKLDFRYLVKDILGESFFYDIFVGFQRFKILQRIDITEGLNLRM